MCVCVSTFSCASLVSFRCFGLDEMAEERRENRAKLIDVDRERMVKSYNEKKFHSKERWRGASQKNLKGVGGFNKDGENREAAPGSE